MYALYMTYKNHI